MEVELALIGLTAAALAVAFAVIGLASGVKIEPLMLERLCLFETTPEDEAKLKILVPETAELFLEALAVLLLVALALLLLLLLLRRDLLLFRRAGKLVVEDLTLPVTGAGAGEVAVAVVDIGSISSYFID